MSEYKCQLCETNTAEIHMDGYTPDTLHLCKTCAEKLLQHLRTELHTKTYKESDKPDAAYIRRWYQPLQYLTQFFQEEDVIETVANHLTKQQLTDDIHIATDSGATQHYNNRPNLYEYLRTENASVPQYDQHGRELVERRYTECAVYRTQAKYQHIHDGEIILELLYKYRPELKPFEFSAYALRHNIENYEIYPKNHIYTPFKALMNRDIEAIKQRNLDYGKTYNNGRYTYEAVCERLNSDEAKHFFEVIKNGGDTQ